MACFPCRVVTWVRSGLSRVFILSKHHEKPRLPHGRAMSLGIPARSTGTLSNITFQPTLFLQPLVFNALLRWVSVFWRQSLFLLSYCISSFRCLFILSGNWRCACHYISESR